MPANLEIDGYVNYLAGHIQRILPEDPRYARRVLRLLMIRVGFRPDWRQIAASAVIAAGLTAFAIDTLDDDQQQARVVKALDGLYYVVIYDYPPGKAIKVLHRTLISPEEAAERVKSSGWQREAVASFNRL